LKILVTGAWGFVDLTLVSARLEGGEHEFMGLDNLTRAGAR
jgi:hypothetical protein